MKIKSINIIEFGGICNLHLDFSDSLNIISGNNESGKSTVLLFVMYMLYGLPKTTRKGTPQAYDKERSLSWEGGTASGSMEIEVDGKAYVISRMSRRRGASECSVTDLATGRVINPVREPGEEILGVSRETFESCCWCGQLRASAINGEGVSQTLANLSLNVDESINAAEVLSRVRGARKEYRHERGPGGLIGDCERELSELRSEQAQLGFDLDQLRRDRQSLEAWRKREQDAEVRLEAADAARSAASAMKLLADFEDLERLESDHARVLDEIAELDANAKRECLPSELSELEAMKYLYKNYTLRRAAYEEVIRRPQKPSGVKEEEVITLRKIGGHQAAEELIEKLDKCCRSVHHCNILAWVISVLSVVLSGICAFFAQSGPLLAASITGGIVGLAASAVFFVTASVCSSRLKHRTEVFELDRKDYEKQIRSAMVQYELYESEVAEREAWQKEIDLAQGAVEVVESEIREKLASYGKEVQGNLAVTLISMIDKSEKYIRSRSSSQQIADVDRELIRRHKQTLDKYDRDSLRASLPADISISSEIDVEAADAEYRTAKANYESYSAHVVDLTIAIKNAEPKAERWRELDDRIEEKRRQLEDYKRRYEVLDLAYSALDEAYGGLKKNFAPKIRKRASEILAELSDGRYERVFIDEDMAVSVEQSGGARAAGTLSGGTSDILYISLRMAIIECIFEQSVPCFFDESLAHLDDRRASGLLKLISEFTKRENQCLVFTCHERESALCSKLGLEFNQIRL